ncbi:MAG: hypothetical protein H7Z72_07175 [Bacteroidetes bacterium]|nr:hypothetical protein [Fibrella sp.]
MDVTALQAIPLDLPPGSELPAHSGYTDYEREDLMADCDQVRLLAVRKSNAKRPDDPATAFLKKYYRRRIETVFSQIKAHFPAKIHAVTPEGYLLKVTLFMMVFAFDQLTI